MSFNTLFFLFPPLICLTTNHSLLYILRSRLKSLAVRINWQKWWKTFLLYLKYSAILPNWKFFLEFFFKKTKKKKSEMTLTNQGNSVHHSLSSYWEKQHCQNTQHNTSRIHMHKHFENPSWTRFLFNWLKKPLFSHTVLCRAICAGN